MARIRTIKPEFPQSETIGALSRDARLLFIQLWTIADDAGRLRGASRMLASLLYPYDDDAPKLIDDWLDELDAKECIRRYEVDGSQYVEIVNWLKHQKIDRPTPSRLPEFHGKPSKPREPSRVIVEPSSTDLGPRTLDHGPRTVDQDSRSQGSRASEWPSDFREQFWTQYPRKVGKTAAFKKLEVLRRNGAVTFTVLMAGVARMPRGDPKFIPHPTTWLNRGGWDDEVPPQSQTGGSNGRQSPSARAYELAARAKQFEFAAGMERPADAVGGDEVGRRPDGAVPEPSRSQ